MFALMTLRGKIPLLLRLSPACCQWGLKVSLFFTQCHVPLVLTLSDSCLLFWSIAYQDKPWCVFLYLKKNHIYVSFQWQTNQISCLVPQHKFQKLQLFLISSCFSSSSYIPKHFVLWPSLSLAFSQSASDILLFWQAHYRLSLFIVSFPEQDVPEQEPAGIHKQCQQRVDQWAVEGVVQYALRDDRQEEHAALGQCYWRFLEVLEEEDGVKDCAAWTEQHHCQGT